MVISAWTPLTRSQTGDKDEPAVRTNPPRSGYILLGVVFGRCTVSVSLRVPSSEERRGKRCILLLWCETATQVVFCRGGR